MATHRREVLMTNLSAPDQRVIEDIRDLSASLSQASDYALYGPAKFWETLSEKHGRLILEYGFQRFKRTVNFEYNQWGVQSFKDPKIRNLLRLLFRRHRVPSGWLRTRVNKESISDVRWPDGIDAATGEAVALSPVNTWKRFQAYTFYVGLLWQYAMLEDRLGCLRVCDEPTVGSPLPITYKGKLISQDLATSSMELNLIAKYVDMSKVVRIAEIGAGYGRLADVTAKMFPHVEYHIFDIPPALAISQNYLACTLGESAVSMFDENPHYGSLEGCRVRAFLPHQMERFPNGYFDLVINISSLDEMAPAQVENYFSRIDEKCGGWLYLKGHGRSRSPGLRLGVDEFPYRKRWRELYRGADPLVGSFVERVYSLHQQDSTSR